MANTEGAGDDRPRPVEHAPRHERVRTAALTSATTADTMNDEGDDPDSIEAVASIAQAQALIYVGDQIGRLVDTLTFQPDPETPRQTVADLLQCILYTVSDALDFYRRMPPGS